MALDLDNDSDYEEVWNNVTETNAPPRFNVTSFVKVVGHEHLNNARVKVLDIKRHQNMYIYKIEDWESNNREKVWLNEHNLVKDADIVEKENIEFLTARVNKPEEEVHGETVYPLFFDKISGKYRLQVLDDNFQTYDASPNELSIVRKRNRQYSKKNLSMLSFQFQQRAIQRSTAAISASSEPLPSVSKQSIDSDDSSDDDIPLPIKKRFLSKKGRK